MPNDARGADGAAIQVPPDRHGQAALLLVESLIHALVARSALSAEEAIEVIEIAADIEREFGGKADGAFVSLLTPLAESLQFEIRS